MKTFWHSGWSRKGNALANLVMVALRPKFRGISAARRYKLARSLIDEAFDRFRSAPNTPEMGCQTSNCFGCCLHQKDVDTSDYEVRVILNRVERENRLADVVSRAEAVVKKEGGACPLLSKEGRCTVYDIRPVTCAAYHSLDRTACHSGANAEIPFHEMLFIEMNVISAFGMVPVEMMDGQCSFPKVRLFAELARLGRVRLQHGQAA